MRAVRTMTIIAFVLLAAVGITIAFLYFSDAYGDRQASADAADPGQDPAGAQDPSEETQSLQNNGIQDASDGTERRHEDGQTPEITDGSTEKEEPGLRFIAVGDIMLGRGVEYWIRKNGSYEMAFGKIKHLLDEGDVVFGNLECPLTSGTKGLDKNRKIVLKGDPESVTALTSAGFNLLSLSNNHIMDYYEKGLFDTMELLDQNGIVHAGGGRNIDEARKPAIIEKNGMKIGLLAYTDMAEIVFAGNPYLSFAAGPEKSGVAPRDYDLIKEDMDKAKEQVDLLAISLHWGIEDSFRVAPEQVEFARRLIDDGADIILGHHPHQFQGIEIYNGKPILYSLGNILFDQNQSENMESFIVDMKYKGTELTELTAVPVRILKKSYVEIQTGKDAESIIKRQIKLCSEFGTEPAAENDILVFK